MPEQDISSEWKSFDEAKRTRLLGKMTPEQKKILRGKLEANPSRPPAGQPIPGSPKGVAYTYRHPRELLQQAATELGETSQTEALKGSTPDVWKGGKLTGQRSQLDQAGHKILSGLAGGGEVIAKLGSGLMDWKTAAGLLVSKLSPAGSAAFFATQGASGAYDAIKNGDTSPENVQNFLLGLSTVAASGAAGAEGGSGLSKVGELRQKVQPFARKVTGVEPAVREAVTKAAEKHGAELAERPAQLKEHAAKVADVKQANTEAETAQSRKAALDSGVEKLSRNFGEELNALDKKVRSEADTKYATVREKIGDAPFPREGLSSAVRKAEAKLQGSSESIKIFRDILSKSGDDVVTSGGMEFGPGTPLYESVKNSPEGLPNAAEPATFADLQGYYSELGDKLSAGNLPGDVYQAMKGLREDVGGMMRQLAESKGAGAELADAQRFYHGYMDTFRDAAGPSGSGSPVAQARVAKDPAYIRKPFTGDSGNRGVEMLAKYSPELAKKARSIAKYDAESSTIPSRAPKAKEPPALPPPPETPVVDTSKVAREAIATRAKNWGSFNARDIGILSASAIGGVLESLLSQRGGYELPIAAATYEGGKYLASRALNNPKVVAWLEKTPPEEAAVLSKIPGADKVTIVAGLTEDAIEQAKAGKPVTLSPEARQLLGPQNSARILAAAGAGSKVKNRKDALNLLGQPSN